MARQPDNILLNFRNVETLDGNNTLNYYYREGVIYIDGEENIPEFKRLDLTNEQLSRTTRLIKREDNSGGQTYTTIEGQTITLQPNDELYVSHNYTGDSNLDKNFDTNSWWYDINWHKSYRTYLVVRYLNTTTSENGEDIYDLRVVDTRTVYKADDEDNKSGVYTFTTIPPDDIGITASVLVDQKFNGNTWETVNLNLYYNNAIIAQETLDTTSTLLPERITLLVDYSKDAIVINDTLKMSVEVDNAPTVHDDSLLITEYTMSISSETEVDAPETILGFNENLSLNRNFDCQPTLNNVTVSRQSEFVQDVDYSVSVIPPVENTFIRESNVSITHNFNTEDITVSVLDQRNNVIATNEYSITLLLNTVTINFIDPITQRPVLKSGTIVVTKNGGGISSPQNLSLILSNKALKANTPDSNYSQYSSIIPKYYGSKTNRTGFNLTNATSYNSQQVNPSTNRDLPLSPFYFTTDNLGSFPNVESKNSYIGYFEKIIDPYPVLNGKTAYFVKYLLDENTDVLDPSLTIQGLNNLKNTFKINDLNNLPTSVKASVQNIDEARELKDLENFATVYTVAEYPSPILFSQTASNGYANIIQMTGSGDLYINNVDLDPDTYKNLAFISPDTVLTEKSVQSENFYIPTTDNPITSLGGGIDSEGDIFAPEEKQLIGEPNEDVYIQNTGQIQITTDHIIDGALTDDYKLYIDYNFYTSHIPPKVNSISDDLVEENFGAMEFLAEIEDIGGIISGLSGLNQDLDIEKVELTAWKPSDPNNLEGPHIKGEGQSVTVDFLKGQVYVPNGISSNRDPIAQIRQEAGKRYVRINFDSLQIYTALREVDASGFPLWLQSGKYNDYQTATQNTSNSLIERGNDPDLNNEIDYFKGAYLQWKVRLVKPIPTPTTTFYDGYNLTIRNRGSITPDVFARKSPIQTQVNLAQNQRIVRQEFTDTSTVIVNHYYNVNPETLIVSVTVDGTTLDPDSYTITYDNTNRLTVNFGNVNRTGRVTVVNGYMAYKRVNNYRCFNPSGIENINVHYLKFDLRGSKTPSSENLGIANAPYWDFVSGNRSRIYLVPPLLNNNYGSGYYQSPSPYTPSINTAFPFSKEPSYTIIPTPSDPLEFFPGDQIRFVNLESQVYTVVNVDQGTVNGNQRIILNLDRNITNGINLDFFLIRRFKPANNFVILNQQKPYGVPPSASSSPGILQTQYQNEELETNPDKVITNLIERNLI